MSEMKVKAHIKKLFTAMNVEVANMVQNSYSSKKVTEDIIQYVSKKIASTSRGYMSTLYSSLSDQTLQEPVFQNVDNANKFFDMELDKKIVDAYKFDSKDSAMFAKGLNIREINRVYASAAAGVGTAAVGGILLGVLSGAVDIPVVGIIAGAIVTGLIGCGVTYSKVVPGINKRHFLAAVKTSMADLEQEMYKWVDGVIAFYNKQVEELKKTL